MERSWESAEGDGELFSWEQRGGVEEPSETLTHEQEGKEAYKDLCRELDNVMRRYYRHERAVFTPPSIDRTRGNLVFIASLFEQRLDKKIDYFDRSFLAGAAIRYVDNFIDEALWPMLEKRMREGKSMEDAEERFEEFLQDIYKTVSVHERYLPEELLELPRTEMRLLLHPDQATFDENIERYFFYKSYNLAYMEHLLTREKAAEPVLWSEKERAQFHLIAAWDVARDLENWSKKEDFDIFHHIQEHKIDPQVMIELLWRIIRENAPKTYVNLPDISTQTYIEFAPDDALNRQEQARIYDCLHMIRSLPRIHTSEREWDTP